MTLDNFRLFIAIVEHGSLSGAGREVGLSPATVSERLTSMEAYYGVSLLVRSTRSVALSAEGRVLLEGARRLLADADGLKTNMQRNAEAISGVIRVSAPVDLGQSRIVPVLDCFLEMHPGVSLDLLLTDGLADLIGQGIDFAIRYGNLADSSLKARRLRNSRVVVCASPSYLLSHGVPQKPQDLAAHDCIVMRLGDKLRRVWEFNSAGRIRTVTVKGRRVANSGELVRRWCLQGLGIAQKSIWDVQEDLAAGRLVEVLGDYAAPASALQIVYPSTIAQPMRVRRAIDFLVEKIGEDPLAEAAAQPSNI